MADVTFSLDGDAGKLLEALTASERAFEQLGDTADRSVAAALPELAKFEQALASLSDPQKITVAQQFGQAIEKMGGASELTGTQLLGINKILEAAEGAYARLGQAAPESLTALHASLFEAAADLRNLVDAADQAGQSTKDTIAHAIQGLNSDEAAKVLDALTDGLRENVERLKDLGGISALTAQQQAGLTTGVGALTEAYLDLGRSAPAPLAAVNDALVQAAIAANATAEATGKFTVEEGKASAAAQVWSGLIGEMFGDAPVIIEKTVAAAKQLTPALDASQVIAIFKDTKASVVDLGAAIHTVASKALPDLTHLGEAARHIADEKAMTDLTRYMEAVKEVGGIAKLSAAELKTFSGVVDTAIQHVGAAGQGMPKWLTALHAGIAEATDDFKFLADGAEHTQDSVAKTFTTMLAGLDAIGQAQVLDTLTTQIEAQVATLEKLGGVAALTATEQHQLSLTVNELIDRYAALGDGVPEHLMAVKTALDAAAIATSSVGESSTELVGQFEAAGTAAEGAADKATVLGEAITAIEGGESLTEIADAAGLVGDETGAATEDVGALDAALRKVDAESIKKLAEETIAAEEAAQKGTLSFGEMFAAVAAGTAAGGLAAQAISKIVDGVRDLIMVLPNMVGHFAEAADNLRNMSARLDISVESLSKMQFVAQVTGTSLEGLARLIQDLQRKMADPTPAFERGLRQLGLAAEELRAMKPEDALFTLLEAMGKVPDASEKAALGVTLLGTRFRQMAHLTTEDLRELMKIAQEAGAEMSTKTAADAAKFELAMAKVDQMIKSVKDRISAALIPALTALAEESTGVGGVMLAMGSGIAGMSGDLVSLGASFATIAAGWGPLTQGAKTAWQWMVALGDATVITTARAWLMNVANKAMALGQWAWNAAAALGGTLMTAMGEGTLITTARLWLQTAATTATTAATWLLNAAMAPLGLAVAGVVLGVAAAIAIFLTAKEAWLWWSGKQEHAKELTDRAATDANNLIIINKALKTSYTDLTEAMKEWYRVLANKPKDPDFTKALGEALDATTVKYRKLAEAKNFAAIKNEVIQASRRGISAEDIQLHTQTKENPAGIDPKTQALLLHNEKLKDDLAAADVKRRTDEKNRMLTGVAAARAELEARKAAALEAIKIQKIENEEHGDRLALQNEVEKTYRADLAKVNFDAAKAHGERMVALTNEQEIAQINIRKRGFDAQMAIIDATEKADRARAQREATPGGVESARIKAQIAREAAIEQQRRASIEKEAEFENRRAQLRIKAQTDGYNQEIALIKENADERIEAFKRTETDVTKIAEETARIRTDAALQVQEKNLTLKKQADVALLAQEHAHRLTLIGETKTGMDAALAVEQENWDFEFAELVKHHAVTEAAVKAHLDRVAAITKAGDDTTEAGTQQAIVAAQEALRVLEEGVGGAKGTWQAIAAAKQKVYDAELKATKDSTAAHALAIVQAQELLDFAIKSGATDAEIRERQTALDTAQQKAAKTFADEQALIYKNRRRDLLLVINDEKQGFRERKKAREDLIELDAAQATTEKKANQIRAQGHRQLYREMHRDVAQWGKAAVAIQKAVAEEAARRSGQVKADWKSAFGTIANVLSAIAEATRGDGTKPPSKASQVLGASAGIAGSMGNLLAMREQQMKADEFGNTKQFGLISSFGQASGKTAKAAAGIAIGMEVLQGAMEIKSATDVAGRGNRMMGGALAGAKAGMMIGGPYGAAIGAGVGLIVGAFRKPAFEKAMEDVGKRYGVKISEGLGRQIQKDAKEKFGGSQQAGELFNMGAIIEEAHGLTDENIDKFTTNLRDVFSLQQQGILTAKQSVEILDKNFGTFADHVLKSGKIASAGFQEIIALNAKSVEQSKEILAFVNQQTARVSGAIAVMIAPLAKASAEIAALAKARDAIAAKRAEGPNQQVENDLLAANNALHAARVKLLGEEGTKTLEANEQLGPGVALAKEQVAVLLEQRDALKAVQQARRDQEMAAAAPGDALVPSDTLLALNKALAESDAKLHAQRLLAIGAERTATIEAVENERSVLQTLTKERERAAAAGTETTALDTQIAETTAQLADFEAAAKKAAGSGVPAIDRAARLLAATFNAAKKDGLGLLEAVDAMGPGLDTLIGTYENLGVSIEGTAVAELAAFRDRINNNRELVASAQAVNEVALAMSNIGALNADTLKDLEAQGLDTNKKLTEAGFSQNEALTMQKDFLQTVIDKHKEMKTPIDAETQALIDQAQAQNILKTEGKSTNDVLMEGFSAIIEAVGGKLPEAFKKFRDEATKKSQEAGDAIVDGVTTGVEAAAAKASDPAVFSGLPAAARTAGNTAGEQLRDGITKGVDMAALKISDPVAWTALVRQAEIAGAAAGGALTTGIGDAAKTATDAVHGFGAGMDEALTHVADPTAWSKFGLHALKATTTADGALTQFGIDLGKTAQRVGTPEGWNAFIDNAEAATTAGGDLLITKMGRAWSIARQDLDDPASWQAFEDHARDAIDSTSDALVDIATEAELAALKIRDPEAWNAYMRQADVAAQEAARALDEVGATIDETAAQLTDTSAWERYRYDAEAAAKDAGLALAGEVSEGIDGANLALSDQGPWQAWLQNIGATAAQASDTIDGEVLGAIDGVAVGLNDTNWKQWGLDGFTAGQLAKGGLKATAGAAGTIDDQLARIDWDAFAGDAEAAAQRAKEAIDTVSFGSSPGGIKEIALQLALAADATTEFARTFGGEMSAAKKAADGLAEHTLVDMAGQMGEMPKMVGSVVHTVSRDTTRETTTAEAQQAMFSSMMDKIQRIAEMPTTVVEAGAVTTTLQAWGIAEREDIERAMAKATLDKIVANSGGLLGNFEHLVNRTAKRP